MIKSLINSKRYTTTAKMFVLKRIYEKLANNFATTIKKISFGGPISTSTKVGALISKQHWQKLTGYIKVDIEKAQN